MEFVEEEIDIKYEFDIYDLDLDHDLGSSSHSMDWKLNPNVECRVMLERMKSLDSEKEVQIRNPYENYEAETETSSGQNESVDKSCGIYRKLKLLVDSLKNFEKRENCGLCEKYIQQLQQHLLLTHENNTGDDEERNSTESHTCMSAPEPVILDQHDVLFEKLNTEVNIPHDGVPANSEVEFVPPLTIAAETGKESTSRDEDPRTIKRKSMHKGRKSKPYKCDTCQMTFLTFYELTQHENTHIEEKRETNNVRKKTPLTPSYFNWQGLPNILQKKRFKCDICLQGFGSSNYLILHKRIHTAEIPHKCDVCGKCFTHYGTLYMHKLTHTGEKRHRCDLCGKCFAQHAQLRRHKRIHIGEKPHKCNVCGTCFAQNSHLARHKLIHTREKPHMCDFCGKCFTRHTQLTSHKLIHTGVKPHGCDLCGKRFTYPIYLTRHKLVHTGEKPYKCDVCGIGFQQNSNLTLHMRTHTGEKPYECDVCGKCFGQKGNLIVHKVVHTGEKAHKCEQCGKCFAHSSSLTKHIQTHTGVKLLQV